MFSEHLRISHFLNIFWIYQMDIVALYDQEVSSSINYRDFFLRKQ